MKKIANNHLLNVISMVGLSPLLLVGSCGRESSGQQDARIGTTIGATSLDGKKFTDADFACITNSGSLTLTAEPTLATVSYEGDIKPLFAAKCVSCHPAVKPPDLTTMALVKTNAAASLADMQGGTMPPGKPLAASDIQLFKSWIDGGYVEPGSTPAPGPTPAPGTPPISKPKPKPKSVPAPIISDACRLPADMEQAAKNADATGTSGKVNPSPPATGPTPTAVTYVTGVQDFLAKKCATCHAAGATPPDLSTYAASKTSGDDSKVTIDSGTMPPPATKVTLTDQEKALFANWAKAGYPEK